MNSFSLCVSLVLYFVFVIQDMLVLYWYIQIFHNASQSERLKKKQNETTTKQQQNNNEKIWPQSQIVTMERDCYSRESR